MKRHACTLIILSLLVFSKGQSQPEKIDSAAVAAIKAEGLERSQIMPMLSELCDVHSPRLTWSPEYRRAADWVAGKFKSMGIPKVTFDNHPPLGKGWSLKNLSAMVTAPVAFPVIAYPAAWSPGFKEKEAELISLEASTPEELSAYKGKLKGKFVLLSEPLAVRSHFTPEAVRLSDSALLRMANADQQPGRGGPRRFPRFDRLSARNIDSALSALAQNFPDMDTAAMRERWMDSQMTPKKLTFAQQEGALAVITPGRGDDGTVLVQSASVPQPSGTPRAQRIQAYDPAAPPIVPQVTFAAEHYNRLYRMLKQGEKVRLEMELLVETTKADSGVNIVAEIPGTDLADEIVMMGGHFDTWHAGTGATDNNSGTAVCMEAARILTVLAHDGLRTRRTIRIGLWSGEEQGLYGSREYVSEMLAQREGESTPAFMGGGPPASLTKRPAYDRFSVYFNHDNGTGRIRGIYLQGNEAARPFFRSVFTAFGDPTAQTITIQNTGGTDHQSFDGVGLPAFQFIQDPIDYDSRTHHYNMDVYDRLQPDDMKQAATIMALCAYAAANRDEKLPRKPLAGPGPR